MKNKKTTGTRHHHPHTTPINLYLVVSVVVEGQYDLGRKVAGHERHGAVQIAEQHVKRFQERKQTRLLLVGHLKVGEHVLLKGGKTKNNCVRFVRSAPKAEHADECV